MRRLSLLLVTLVGLYASSLSALMRKDAFVEADCQYELSICSVFQQEAPYLREWIEFHKLLGVQHFFLFNNNSEDHYLEVLQPYIDDGEVELFDWPTDPNEPGFRQIEALQTGIDLARGRSRWLANIDVDEFIVPMTTDNILDFLADFEDMAQVYIRWHRFGTSYVEKIPEDKLLVETLRLAATLFPGLDVHGKVIVKPHRILQANIHTCAALDTFRSWDTNPGGILTDPPIKINHYWTRDEDFLVHVKKPRRERYEQRAWTPEVLEAYFRMDNQEEDHSMDRFIPALRDILFPGDESCEES